MATKANREAILTWTNNRGRNGHDVPCNIPDDQCAEALNVILDENGLGTKRFGSSVLPTTPGGGFAINQFNGVNQLGFTQFSDANLGQTYPKLWLFDRSTPTKLLSIDEDNVSTAITPVDAVQTRPQDSDFVQLDNVLYIAYDSAVNRLHDVVAGAPQVVGIAAPAAPTVADTGAGTYPADPRFYRVQFLQRTGGGALITYSDLGDAVSFTPSGTGTAARVTRPTVPDQANFWRVFGSEDGLLYFLLSGDIAIATTTYDDSVDPDDYDDGEAAPLEGTYGVWPSVRFLLSTGNRLMGYGGFESADGDAVPTVPGRVYWSPVLNTLDGNDAMRISNTIEIKGWSDVSRSEGSQDRAIAGPLDNAVYVFQSIGIQCLIPTEDATSPFRRVVLDKSKGAVNQWSTFNGQDEAGAPCIYFLDPERGPYRFGSHGFQWLGYDVTDIWATMNLAAEVDPNETAIDRIAYGRWVPEFRQAWFFLATGEATDPNIAIVFHANLGHAVPGSNEVRGGWSVFTGPELVGVRAAIIRGYLGDFIGGVAGGLTTLIDDSVVEDSGVEFTSPITSKAFDVSPLHIEKQIGDAFVQTSALQDGQIRLTITKDYGKESRAFDVGIDPDGAESRVIKRFSSAAMTGAKTLQFTVSDAPDPNVGIVAYDQLVVSAERFS